MSLRNAFSDCRVEVATEAPSTLLLAALLSDMGAKVLRAGIPLSGRALEEVLAQSSLHPPLASLTVIWAEGSATVEFRLAQDRLCDHAFEDAVAWGLGGLASLTGELDGPPIAPGSPIAAYCSALYGLLAIAATRYGRQRESFVSISLSDVVAGLTEVAGLQFAVDGSIRSRAGDWWGRAGWGPYDAHDGIVAIALRDLQQLHAFAGFLASEEMLSAKFNDFAWGMCSERDELNAYLVRGLLEKRVSEVVVFCHDARIACAPVLPLGQLLADPHLEARDAFRSVDTLRVPALPLRQHGLRTNMPARSGGTDLAPLLGLRVIDMSSVWAGPMAARILADLGASVLKVSAPAKRVGSYSSGSKQWDRDFYAILNDRNKLATWADLSREDDRELLLEQAARADVLIENFLPGSLQRLGLGHDRLLSVSPNLTVVSMPAMGLSGPDRAAAGYGSTIEQSAGIGWLYTDSEGRPHRSGVNFSDPIAALWAAVGAILGSRSGGGAVVEVSQQEAALSLMRTALTRFQMYGEVPRAIEAGWDESSNRWRFATCSNEGCSSVAVRDVAEVMGEPSRPGTPSIPWYKHPNGVFFPLPRLPWSSVMGSAVTPSPVTMPAYLGDAQW